MNLREIVKRIHNNADVIMNLSSEDLRKLAKKDETTTEFGSASYVSKIRNRSAKFTEAVEDEPNEEQKRTIQEVVNYLKGKKLIAVDRIMGEGFKIRCRSYVTQDFARILYIWQQSLFEPMEGEPEIITIDVPEWKEIKIMAFAKYGITFILGSDYFGECKKAALRMIMYKIKQKGGLGLHAGSKIIRVKNNGEIKEKGFILFGLSGIGKTTLTVHDHNLTGDEGVIIKQDDVILMTKDGYCYGTERGFYIKTEDLDKSQKVLYNAAIKPTTVLDNVYVSEDCKIDFTNYSLTTNGRGIIQRSDIPQIDNSIDMKKPQVVVFITRRYDIIPPIAKLTLEQGAAAFMLGESIETSAGDPTKAGQSKREVGTNPFIVGPEFEEGNKFLEILRINPDMQCYILNTGIVGGTDKGDKITIEDSTRIMTEIAHERIKWKKDPTWGYEIPEVVEGVDPKKLDPRNYYSEEEYNKLCEKLREERREWLSKFPGLEQSIINAFDSFQSY